MFFIIMAHDAAGALDKRLATRQEHIDYWLDQGDTVKVAGAMLDGDTAAGSAFLIEADDEAAARALLAADPFSVHGVFGQDIVVQAIRPGLGVWNPA